MWLEKTANGKTKFVEQYKDPLTGRKKRVSVTMTKNTTHTKKEAQRVLERRITGIMNKSIDGTIKEGITLKQLADEWYEDYKKRIARTTAYNTKTKKKTILLLFGEDTLVTKITSNLIVSKIEGFLYDDGGHSNKFAKAVLQKLGQMFQYALIHNYISDNPQRKATELIQWKNERNAPTAITDKYLTDKEYHDICAYTAMKNMDLFDLFQWLYLTGMRCGEAASLEPADIFQEDGIYYVKVTSTLSEAGLKLDEAYREDTPKSEASFRNVSLPNRAIEIYNRRAANLKPCDFLFTNANAYNKDKKVSVRTVDNFLKKAVNDLKLSKKVTSHFFRHTHVSKLAEMGIPLYQIQRRVGHGDSDITRKVYLHITKEADEDLAKKIKNL